MKTGFGPFTMPYAVSAGLSLSAAAAAPGGAAVPSARIFRPNPVTRTAVWPKEQAVS